MVKKGYLQEGRSHHPRVRMKQEGASSAIARIISLLNVHTIVTMMMIAKRARRRRMARRPSRRRRMVHMWSPRIVMLPQVMMKRPPRIRLLQALLSMRSLLFNTLSTCFMAKATKVQSDDECDEEHDKNESESDDDDDDEPTKDELFVMLEDGKEYFDIKRRECKNL
jgi:hypothetical protein